MLCVWEGLSKMCKGGPNRGERGGCDPFCLHDVFFYPFQVVELALCKLFVNFGIDELVVTMSATMNAPATPTVAGSPGTPSRGSFTVRSPIL